MRNRALLLIAIGACGVILGNWWYPFVRSRAISELPDAGAMTMSILMAILIVMAATYFVWAMARFVKGDS